MKDYPLKTCIDRLPPDQFVLASAQFAIRENLQNLPVVQPPPHLITRANRRYESLDRSKLAQIKPEHQRSLLQQYTKVSSPSYLSDLRLNLPTPSAPQQDWKTAPEPGEIDPFFLALLTGKRWQPGRVLRVLFLQGDSVLQQRVQEVALEWTQYTNISFEFLDDPSVDSDIRIAFRQGDGSWSLLGTDALLLGPTEPTMNFGWLTATSSENDLRRTVLHEFGHALDAIHEHQNPRVTIPWDSEAVYRYFAGPPNYWDKDKVDQNLFRRYEQQDTNSSEFDPASIMLYPIPNEFTIGDYEIGWNNVLSETDRQFIAQMYPGSTFVAPGNGRDRLSIGARQEVAITTPDETVQFQLEVPDSGIYKIETTGGLDTVMELYQLGNDTPLAENDDADEAFGNNARIVHPLEMGQYAVHVHLYQPMDEAPRTGVFGIEVQPVN